MWEKGKSGNPSGRPKGAEGRFRAIAESRVYVAKDGTEHRGLDALASVLLDIALDPNEAAKDRAVAADKYVNRGWGLVKQQIEISGDLGTGGEDWSTRSLEERRQLLELAGKLGVLTDDSESNTEH